MGRKKILNLSIGAALGLAGSTLLAISAYAEGQVGIPLSQQASVTVSHTSVSVSTDGPVTMSVVPSDTGTLVVGKSNVHVETNSSTGYRLYLAGANYNESTRLAGLYRNGNTSDGEITAVNTTSTPTALGQNQWGFSSAVTADGFSASTAYDAIMNKEMTSAESEINALTWKGMKGDFQYLTSGTQDGSSTMIQDDVPVYYGVLAKASGLATGNYYNTIIYTAFVDGSDTVTVNGNNPVDLTEANTSTTVHITTEHQNSAFPVTAGQIEVELFDSADASKQIATCTNIVVDGTKNGTYGNPLEFDCTLTRLSGAVSSLTNNYDIIVKVDADNKGIYNIYEEQDCWRFITTWNYSLTFNGNGATSGTPSDQTGTKKETESFTYTLPANPTRTNYTFNNWSDGSTTYTAGNTITLTNTNESTRSKTLTANWTEQTWTYTLSYNLNGGKYNNSTTISKTTGTAGKATESSKSVAVVTTSSSNPTKDNHTFLGWSTNASATAADSGLGVGQSASVTLTTSSPSKTLYAVWKANKTYFQTVGTTQAEAKAWCKSRTIWNSTNNAEYTLYDSRDGKGYLVRRLADGNCWMVQNLALESGTTEATRRTITPADSNVTSNYKLPISKRGPSGSWSDNDTQYMWNGTHQDATKDTAPSANNDTSAANMGAYYSFLTATAYTGVGDSGDATQSICPKWWHLPTSRTMDKEFGQLSASYNNNLSTFKDAFNSVPTCLCGGTNCPFAGDDAFYWSASIYGTNGYGLNVTSTGVYPTSNTGKKFGRPVRCMLTGGL